MKSPLAPAETPFAVQLNNNNNNNNPICIMAVGLTQPLTEMNARNILEE
jgi:hypothetical protein